MEQEQDGRRWRRTVMGESGRGASEGGREGEDRRREGGKEKKMHKQMLALGIDAISSVSQLMTNSMENRE